RDSPLALSRLLSSTDPLVFGWFDLVTSCTAPRLFRIRNAVKGICSVADFVRPAQCGAMTKRAEPVGSGKSSPYRVVSRMSQGFADRLAIAVTAYRQANQ